ncbi:MAG: gamma-glutamyltransferase, partial [Gammaproteobacteria bacterium]
MKQVLLLTAFTLLIACTSTHLPDRFRSAPHPPQLEVSQLKASPSKAAIASAHPLATQAGIEVLAQGGNAFDAAVAVAAVLSVVEPYSAGLGGGGFWLVQRPDEAAVVIDARETTPHALTNNHFLTKNHFDRDKAINGPLAAGIPGQAAAFAYIAEQYGTLPLSTTLSRAIQYAKQGFPVDK